MSIAAEKLPLRHRDVRKKNQRAVFQISLPRLYWARNTVYLEKKMCIKKTGRYQFVTVRYESRVKIFKKQGFRIQRLAGLSYPKI
jgi:hypothetical protein